MDYILMRNNSSDRVEKSFWWKQKNYYPGLCTFKIQEIRNA